MSEIIYILIIVLECIGIYCAFHALLNKQNPGAAFSWIMVNLFFIALGPILYYLFGINRTQRRANQLRNTQTNQFKTDYQFETETICLNTDISDQFCSLAKLSGALTDLPLTQGNRIQLLKNGEEIFPKMLNEIKQAQTSIYLSTYIFDTDEIGKAFINALAHAHNRGVKVNVLIDSYGEAFQVPWASTLLKRCGVTTACFLPIFPIPRINLRNHKKILVIDGKTAFTGGINISARHMARSDNADRVIDVHFKLQGAIVKQIEYEFISDWHYVTGNKLNADMLSIQQYSDNTICRALSDGPDNDIDIFIETLINAFAAAQKSILIMTPYFIPTPEITASLKAAATRGVDVTIVLSKKTDLPYINWATNNILGKFIGSGAKVYYQPAPFVHAKLILVDQYYAQIGSVNIDPRSLKLNFEFAVEIYDSAFANSIDQYFSAAIAQSTLQTLENINNRPSIIKVRDAFAWLFSPYL